MTMDNESLRQAYERDGYIILENMLSMDEVSQLVTAGRTLLADHAAARSVLVGASALSETFSQVIQVPRLMVVLAELMPGKISFLSDKLVEKSSVQRFPTPWHQDVAYWPGTRPKLSVWIALDDANAANGALRVIPGSHRETLSHVSGPGTGAGEFINTLPLRSDPDGAITVTVAAGSGVIFSDRLIHGSHRNDSGKNRLSLISTYHQTGEDEPFDLMFPARRDL